VARRLAGSSDLYQGHGKLPINSINFMTCHDAFTLNDLVRYNEKHDQATSTVTVSWTSMTSCWTRDVTVASYPVLLGNGDRPSALPPVARSANCFLTCCEVVS